MRQFCRFTAAVRCLFAGSAALAALIVIPATVEAQSPVDSAALVTRLGADTLVLERFVRSPRLVEAEVLLRVPTTTRTRYRLELGADGQVTRWESVTRDPATGEPLDGARETVTRVGDSLRVETTAGGQTRSRMIAAAPGTLPFIDMIHWPYELVLERARVAGVPAGTQRVQPLLTGGRTSDFTVGVLSPDSMTITHPFRGTMRVRVDGRGRLIGLDAGATTRKLVVERRPWMALDAIARRWLADDAAGRNLGALSGRGEAAATLGAAQIAVDYGTPAMRGRRIWGGLVPFGEVWRTGANLATHLTTDRTLVFGAGADTLVVPAGRYTIFSVPAADGGQLIINRQTGQNGTGYDAARDLGRVPMSPRPLAAPVEIFTIAVDETAQDAGLLRLQWDGTEYVTPFRVRP